MELSISTITLTVCEKIGVALGLNDFEKFFQLASEKQYFVFTHYNFLYSYPEFGKKWANGEICQFHRVNTECHICKSVPDRNYAGIGTLYLVKQLESATSKYSVEFDGKKKYKIIPISPEAKNVKGNRMILLCHNHIRDYDQWD